MDNFVYFEAVLDNFMYSSKKVSRRWCSHFQDLLSIPRIFQEIQKLSGKNPKNVGVVIIRIHSEFFHSKFFPKAETLMLFVNDNSIDTFFRFMSITFSTDFNLPGDGFGISLAGWIQNMKEKKY